MQSVGSVMAAVYVWLNLFVNRILQLWYPVVQLRRRRNTSPAPNCRPQVWCILGMEGLQSIQGVVHPKQFLCGVHDMAVEK